MPGWKQRAVQDPRLARTDPVDIARSATLVEQPTHGVHRGLATADDHVAGRGLRNARERADRDAPNPVGHVERRRVRSRNAGRHVGRVDDAPAHRHARLHAGQPRSEPPLVEVVAHREEAHSARRQQAVTHDLVVVTADLRSACSLVEAGIPPVELDPVRTERGRVHAVVRRRLMQLNEGIRLEPVTTRPMPTIDHHDVGIGVFDEGVDEPHSQRTRADDEVVGLDLHGPAHGTRTVTVHFGTNKRRTTAAEARVSSRYGRTGPLGPALVARDGWGCDRASGDEHRSGGTGGTRRASPTR